MQMLRWMLICVVAAGLLSAPSVSAEGEAAVVEKLATVTATTVVAPENPTTDDPNLGEKVGKLMSQKEAAVLAEDYLLANKLKMQIAAISTTALKKPIQSGFFHAFLSSISMIIVSEIGDKTFFIAAIMAMRNSRAEVSTRMRFFFLRFLLRAAIQTFAFFPRAQVFFSATAALAVMTVLSAALGFALPTFLPKTYTHYAATVLFLFFGVKLLKVLLFLQPFSC